MHRASSVHADDMTRRAEKSLQKLKGRDHLQRPRCRWEGSINMDMGAGSTWVRTGYRGWLVTWC